MLHWIEALDSRMLQIAALALLALAALLAGGVLLWRTLRQERSRLRVDAALAGARYEDEDADGAGARPALERAVGAATVIGGRWGAGRYGTLLLEGEDRALLDLCGYRSMGQACALFSFARAVLSVSLALAAVLLQSQARLGGGTLWMALALAFVGFALGWMLPKWVIARRAARRKRAADAELPLLVDLLRLLQGVGLSMDQSLHVVVNEFREVMPVLSVELGLAVDQYTRGRSREQSLARLAVGFGNEELSAICRLIAQVDQHGGAVQEPMQRFGERLREQRKLDLKEKVGKLTVKMTGVMVLTLLPALLIVTAGPGFVAIFHSLSHIGGR